jgi:hypothetical protein
MVIASGQFWDSTFGDGRTYIDAFLLAVILLIAAPVGVVSGAVCGAVAGAVSDGARKAHASLVVDRVFAGHRVITNKRLGLLAAVAFAALVVVARRRVLAQ